MLLAMRLVILLGRFDPFKVPVKQSFTVSQIVGCPVIFSSLVLLESVNMSFVRCP